LRERKNGLSQHRSQTETLRSLKYGNDPGVVDTCGARSLTVPRKTRHYARSLSNGLQLPKEVSLHTANGVGEDQIVGLGIFGDHPVPQFVHERRGNGQLDQQVLRRPSSSLPSGGLLPVDSTLAHNKLFPSSAHRGFPLDSDNLPTIT
jgi:hypothetical protein